MENENNNARRYPHNSGLPNFAMETTSSEDTANPETFAEIYSEKLLEKAFRYLPIEDVIPKLIRICINLTDSETNEDDKIYAILKLEEYVECEEAADYFCKIGGLRVLMKCLDSYWTPLQKCTLRTICLMVEDNPFCQQQFSDNSFLPKLVQLTYDSELMGMALYAICGIIRTYQPAIDNIMDIGFFENVLAYFYCDYILSVGILYFLQELIRDYPIVREELLELGIIQILTPVLNHATTNYDIMIEMSCSILNSLSESSDVWRIFRICVKLSIEQIIKLQKDNPSSEETIEFCESILEKLFSINGAPAVDR